MNLPSKYLGSSSLLKGTEAPQLHDPPSPGLVKGMMKMLFSPAHCSSSTQKATWSNSQRPTRTKSPAVFPGGPSQGSQSQDGGDTVPDWRPQHLSKERRHRSRTNLRSPLG